MTAAHTVIHPRYKRTRMLAIAASAMAILTGGLHARSLPPADECAVDSSFRTFRAELLEAIAQKNERFLLQIIAPGIKVNLGSDGEGREAFVREWKLDQPASSPIWAELRTILALGCARDGMGMMVPYLFARFPDDLDPFEAMVVIKPDAVLKAAPKQEAPEKAKIPAWTILVRTEEAEEPEGWLGVRASDDLSGYVEAQSVRSPNDYRALFEKRKGRWTMTSLLAGD